jgi:hypothetical protein
MNDDLKAKIGKWYTEARKEVARSIVLQYSGISSFFYTCGMVSKYAAGKWGGDMVLAVVVTAIGTIGSGYVLKLKRYFANVRFRVGKFQKTDTGREDYWTVITKKTMPNILTDPAIHFLRPWPCLEITMDTKSGSIRHTWRPISAVSLTEKLVFDIGTADSAPESAIKYYQDLKDNKNSLDEKSFEILEGLEIMERDGLLFDSKALARKDRQDLATGDDTNETKRLLREIKSDVGLKERVEELKNELDDRKSSVTKHVKKKILAELRSMIKEALADLPGSKTDCFRDMTGLRNPHKKDKNG